VEQQSFSVIGVSIRTSGEKEAAGNGKIPAQWTRVTQDGTLERIPNRADDKILVAYADFASNHKGGYTYILEGAGHVDGQSSGRDGGLYGSGKVSMPWSSPTRAPLAASTGRSRRWISTLASK